MSLIISIRKKAGSFLLDVNLEIQNGVMSILGASGCGKSMTLKCVAGIEEPDEGHILLDDRVLFDSKKKVNLPPQKRHIGYMFQDYALFPNMTVKQNIMTGMSEKNKAEQVKEFVRNFHLEGLENQYPSELSGGQKQRVAMARMMAADPRVILLDEPFAALDSYLKNQMLREMKTELAKRNLPVMLVTHDREEAFALGDTVCAMERGKNDPPVGKKDFFADPKTIHAAVLSGCKNISPVKVVDEHHILATAWNMLLSVEHIPKDAAAVGIRAHDLVPMPCTQASDEERGMVVPGSGAEEMESMTPQVDSCQVEEAAFEWNVYLRFFGSTEYFVWKVPKSTIVVEKQIDVPRYFKVKREHILLLRKS
jgi:molybdate transport system ATP-binding protein